MKNEKKVKDREKYKWGIHLLLSQLYFSQSYNYIYFFHPFQMYSSPSVIRERQPLISSRVRTELSGLLSIRSRTVLMARAEEREIYGGGGDSDDRIRKRSRSTILKTNSVTQKWHCSQHFTPFLKCSIWTNLTFKDELEILNYCNWRFVTYGILTLSYGSSTLVVANQTFSTYFLCSEYWVMRLSGKVGILSAAGGGGEDIHSKSKKMAISAFQFKIIGG